ncbi:hypothetical protein [Streptosporangium sp. NPDC051022]|uniref:hypothetical protein n=1 Tax=Streptosporangium sp. NPDC051022 TaxID=3155752 RepID=UPI00341E0C86
MRVSRVRLGGDDYRVIRPDRPPRRAFLFDDGRWSLDMYVDREATAVLAMAWGLASRSRHSLIYLPMRANTPPLGLTRHGCESVPLEPLDLVLVQHSVQFQASRWPAVRARLGGGHLQTATLPEDVFPEADTIDYDRIRTRRYRDHLRFDLAARTLFVVGGPEAFRRTGASDIRPLVTEGPAHMARWPDGHFCAELDSRYWPVPPPRRCSGFLHIDYRRTWTV